jgi:methylthioribose-1-phosphate isomerase
LIHWNGLSRRLNKEELLFVKVDGKHYNTIWIKPNDESVIQIIDQRWLPHRFVIEDLTTVEQAATAIKDMHVRGAPLIGVTAAYGMYLAALSAADETESNFMRILDESSDLLRSSRPTAVNLFWALDRQINGLRSIEGDVAAMIQIILELAGEIASDELESCRLIGEHGVGLIESISQAKSGETVNILTHCNAGWLACVDYGTATSPIYLAHDNGIKVHVWVDETRPRNQGSRLTAWELGQHGVPHTIVADNVGGHLMQHDMVDMVITGSDRTVYTGDVANKIGTYLKALAAQDNNVPFYVALPSSTFDWENTDGVAQIPIEERDESEVKNIIGLNEGEIKSVLLAPETSAAANFAFDVTPSRLVTALITERGICSANEKGVLGLFPEKSDQVK